MDLSAALTAHHSAVACCGGQMPLRGTMRVAAAIVLWCAALASWYAERTLSHSRACRLGSHKGSRRMLDRTSPIARSRPRLDPIAAFALAAGIFSIDTFSSLDSAAIAVGYVVVVLISANFLNRNGLLAVGVLCGFLTLASFAIVHGGTYESDPIARCLISLCAITITTFLALKNQQATLELRNQAALLELTHDAIFVRDGDDVITYWNAGAEEEYGWTSEQAVGKRATELLKTRFPDSREHVMQQLHAADRWEGELAHTKRDGTEVMVASRWSLQRDERGRPVATLEINNDITERKRADEKLRQAQAELSHVARVTTLGELAASIAHEVNQPLAAVVTNGEACLRWLLRDVPVLEEVRSSVERMINDGRRASQVLARLRGLARKSEPRQLPLDVNEVIHDVLPVVEQEMIEQRVVLHLDLEPAPPAILGDRVQLQQVIINLAMNAIQAMASITDRPRLLSIRSRTQTSDGGEGSLIVEVRDSGVGIDPSSAALLFTPFHTTKPNGMGMGLSICRSIVEAHGGRISVAAGVERGACFIVRLPVLKEALS
jgi:PAS domain S-box-containing protein